MCGWLNDSMKKWISQLTAWRDLGRSKPSHILFHLFLLFKCLVLSLAAQTPVRQESVYFRDWLGTPALIGNLRIQGDSYCFHLPSTQFILLLVVAPWFPLGKLSWLVEGQLGGTVNQRVSLVGSMAPLRCPFPDCWDLWIWYITWRKGLSYVIKVSDLKIRRFFWISWWVRYKHTSP